MKKDKHEGQGRAGSRESVRAIMGDGAGSGSGVWGLARALPTSANNASVLRFLYSLITVVTREARMPRPTQRGSPLQEKIFYSLTTACHRFSTCNCSRHPSARYICSACTGANCCTGHTDVEREREAKKPKRHFERAALTVLTFSLSFALIAFCAGNMSTPSGMTAKEKAAARRAKILAKEGSRLQLAKGELGSLQMDSPAPDDAPTDSGKKERPLAARRSIIRRTAKEPEAVPEPENAAESKDGSSTNGDIPSSSSSSRGSKGTGSAELKTTTANVTDDGEDVKTSSLTPMSVKKIELEVAENTAKFDEKMLSGNKDQDGKASTKKNAKAKAAAKLKAKTNAPKPIEAWHIMRFIRVLFVILMGAVTGYYAATDRPPASILTPHQRISIGRVALLTERLGMFTSGEIPAAAAPVEQDDDRDELASFLGSDGGEIGEEYVAVPSTERTWMQWGQWYAWTQVTCSFSAIGLVYWLAGLFNDRVKARFPTQQQSGGNFLQVLINFYTNGIESIMETCLGVFGEVALHFFVAVGSTMLIVYLMENDAVEDFKLVTAASKEYVLTSTAPLRAQIMANPLVMQVVEQSSPYAEQLVTATAPYREQVASTTLRLYDKSMVATELLLTAVAAHRERLMQTVSGLLGQGAGEGAAGKPQSVVGGNSDSEKGSGGDGQGEEL